MSNLLLLTSTQLKRAADIKDKIAALEHELAAVLGEKAVSAAPEKNYTMSAVARARIAAAQRARWARVKGRKPAGRPVAKGPAGRRGMSASAKARLSALAKVRWARVKAAGKRAL